MESMVLTAAEAELLKGNANLIELLPGSDDSTPRIVIMLLLPNGPE